MGINEAWKATCRTLLGAEIGDLAPYGDYLSGGLDITLAERKSALSGKTTFISSPDMEKGAKFMDAGEIGQYRAMTAKMGLDINQIKDLDSILAALSEKFYYAGSIKLGRFQEIEESDKCTDSSCVHHSQMVYENSRFIGFSNMVRVNEYCFGATVPGESKFMICSYLGWRNARGFETLRTFSSSDCYYTANVDGSNNCMFSFNQRSKSHLIGNLKLPKDKYKQLKEKLVSEIRETLKAKKKVPHVFEIIADTPRSAKALDLDREPLPASFGVVEKSFGETTRIVLGKALSPLKRYGKYLSRHVGEVSAVESVVSGKAVMISPVGFCTAVKNNVMTLEESIGFGKNRLEEKDVDGLTLENASRALERIKSVGVDADIGTNVNMLQCSVSGNDSANAFRSFLVFKAKNTAYARWPRDTENAFGSFNLVLSKFCIKCYSSVNLTRCFEVEGSNDCSDCYFCHNCEGLSNCMFCFNAKSLRYAVGNVEVGPQEYARIKKLVLGEVLSRLERDGDLELSIYNVGCGKKV